MIISKLLTVYMRRCQHRRRRGREDGKERRNVQEKEEKRTQIRRRRRNLRHGSIRVVPPDGVKPRRRSQLDSRDGVVDPNHLLRESIEGDPALELEGADG